MASQGPFMGTVMWPQAERSCCLFAEGGKTQLRATDSASPWCSRLSASVCPGSLAQITQGGGPGTRHGAALALKPKQGRTSRGRVAQETAWALPLKMAVISALEGGETSGIPHAQSVAPQPPSQLKSPTLSTRGLRVF